MYFRHHYYQTFSEELCNVILIGRISPKLRHGLIYVADYDYEEDKYYRDRPKEGAQESTEPMKELKEKEKDSKVDQKEMEKSSEQAEKGATESGKKLNQKSYKEKAKNKHQKPKGKQSKKEKSRDAYHKGDKKKSGSYQDYREWDTDRIEKEKQKAEQEAKKEEEKAEVVDTLDYYSIYFTLIFLLEDRIHTVKYFNRTKQNEMKRFHRYW